MDNCSNVQDITTAADTDFDNLGEILAGVFHNNEWYWTQADGSLMLDGTGGQGGGLFPGGGF